MATKAKKSEPSKLSKGLKFLDREKKRVLPLAAVLGFMYWYDSEGFGVVIYMLGLMTTIAVASGILRRIMFPRLDMGVVANKADETPMSSAIVFIGVCLVISAIILSVGGMLH